MEALVVDMLLWLVVCVFSHLVARHRVSPRLIFLVAIRPPVCSPWYGLLGRTTKNNHFVQK